VSQQRTVTTPTEVDVTRARWLLMVMFGLLGVTSSSWLARLPSVRGLLGLSPAGLGSLLIVGALGSLLTVTVSGYLVTRFGGRLTMTVSAVGLAIAFVLIGLGTAIPSVALVALGVFLTGSSAALGSIPLNIETAAVERRVGRAIMPQFHAGFSIGAVLGSLFGAAMAALQVTPFAQFTAVAVVGLAIRLYAIPHVIIESGVRSPTAWDAADAGATGGAASSGVAWQDVQAARTSRGSGIRSALSAWRERRTVLIGVVILSAALSEGAANNWLAIAVVDGFHRAEAVGGVMFAVFVGSMTLVRMLGTRLIDRFGRVAVLRTSGLVSLGGLLAFGLMPSLSLAGIGVMAWGLGAALAVPIGISAASEEPARAAARVSVVSSFSSMASLSAPPLLGLVVQQIGARHALLLICVAMVVSVAVSGTVRRAEPALRGGAAEAVPERIPSGHLVEIAADCKVPA